MENGIIISWVVVSAIELENGQLRQGLSTFDAAETWIMADCVLVEYGE